MFNDIVVRLTRSAKGVRRVYALVAPMEQLLTLMEIVVRLTRIANGDKIECFPVCSIGLFFKSSERLKRWAR